MERSSIRAPSPPSYRCTPTTPSTPQAPPSAMSSFPGRCRPPSPPPCLRHRLGHLCDGANRGDHRCDVGRPDLLHDRRLHSHAEQPGDCLRRYGARQPKPHPEGRRVCLRLHFQPRDYGRWLWRSGPPRRSRVRRRPRPRWGSRSATKSRPATPRPATMRPDSPRDYRSTPSSGLDFRNADRNGSPDRDPVGDQLLRDGNQARSRSRSEPCPPSRVPRPRRRPWDSRSATKSPPATLRPATMRLGCPPAYRSIPPRA